MPSVLQTLFSLSAGQNFKERLFFGVAWSLSGMDMQSQYKVVSTAVDSGMIDHKMVSNNY